MTWTLDAVRAACASEPAATAMAGLRLAHDLPQLAAGAIDDDKRAELIELSLAGKHIELDLDLVAYVQSPDVRNRKCVRFRPGRLQAIARTGVGNPFLRNHEQGELMSAGGLITSSKMVRHGTARELHQTARLTVPWAVQAALQSVLGKFSIGWWPTGDIHCSLCQAPIDACLWKLGHWRGSVHDGQVVEFIFQDAQLLETSAVNVPAVPETHMRGLRPRTDAIDTSGSAHQPAIDELFALGAHWRPGLVPTLTQGAPTVADTPNPLADINAALALQAAASGASTLAAIAQLQNDRDLARSQLADVTAERDAAIAERDQLRADKVALEQQRQTERADEFVARAIESGKCARASATASYFRDLFLRDEDAAEESLQAAPRLTPVGLPMQSQPTHKPAQPPTAASGAPDYESLACQLSADDLATARLAGVTATAYVQANYDDLAPDYCWPARA